MGMAKRVDAKARQEIEVTLALDVEKVDALTPRESHRIAGIGIEEILLL
jgi:hypothetical protein